MKAKKLIIWFTIFSLLTVYSLQLLRHYNDSAPHTVYAATPSDMIDEQKRTLFARIIDRLSSAKNTRKNSATPAVGPAVKYTAQPRVSSRASSSCSHPMSVKLLWLSLFAVLALSFGTSCPAWVRYRRWRMAHLLHCVFSLCHWAHVVHILASGQRRPFPAPVRILQR